MNALAACGGDDGATVDAPGGDASPDAAMHPYGAIFVLENRTSGMNATVMGAGFGDNTTMTISTRTDGPCQITQQANMMPGPTVSAGTVSISGGGTASIALTQAPAPDNAYFTQTIGFRYAVNDVVTVTATGATVPAFSSMVTFPAPLTVTSPTALTSLSKAGLALTWTPTSGSVRVFIAQYPTTPDTLITCEFDASLGTARVLASALAELTVGQTASISINTQARTMSTAGPYELTFVAAFSGFSASVTVQP